MRFLATAAFASVPSSGMVSPGPILCQRSHQLQLATLPHRENKTMNGIEGVTPSTNSIFEGLRTPKTSVGEPSAPPQNPNSGVFQNGDPKMVGFLVMSL